MIKPSNTRNTKVGNLKNSKGFTLVETLLVILVLAVIGFGGYYVWQNQHKDETKVSSNKSTATKTETKSQSSDPYQGWKSYTLPYEKLSFKYPSDWTLSDERATNRDVVSVKSADNFTVDIQVGIQAGGDPLESVGDWSTQFNGSQAYLTFISGGTRFNPNTSVTGAAILVSKPGDYTSIPADKNVKGCAGCNGVNGPEDSYMSIGMYYDPHKEMSVDAAKSDLGYNKGKLIVESMHY